MNADFLSSLAGVLLSLAASYLPGFAGWYAGLEASRKRLLMLGLLALVSLGVYGLACAPQLAPALAGLGRPPLACDPAGLGSLGRAFLAALIANQAAYLISPRPLSRLGRAG